MSEIVWEFHPVALLEEVPSEGAWRERIRTIAGVGLAGVAALCLRAGG